MFYVIRDVIKFSFWFFNLYIMDNINNLKLTLLKDYFLSKNRVINYVVQAQGLTIPQSMYFIFYINYDV